MDLFAFFAKALRNFIKNADGSFQFLYNIFEVKTLQTLWSLKSFILKKTLQCQINQLTDVERAFLF